MVPLKENIRALLEGRSRPLVVMGLTSLVALVCLYPAADEYLTLRERGTEAQTALEEAQLQVEDLAWLTSTATEIGTELADLQARAVSESDLHELRGWLAETARATGCHMRKSEPQAVHVRPWHAEDNPFQLPRTTEENPETPYDLTTQTVRLILAGSLPEVREFLTQLQAQNHLLHTRRFHLKPEDQQTDEVVLELEILLYHLGPRIAGPSA